MEKNIFIRILFFRIYADFEADIEIVSSDLGNKTTESFKQNPEVNGYYIVSEMDTVSQSGYFEFLLGSNIVDWFLDEVIRTENKMALYFESTNKDIIMTQKDDEH